MRKHLLKKLIKITIMISLISCMLVSNILLQGTVLANGSDIYNESTSTETTSEATTASEPTESFVQTEEPEESSAQTEESANTTYAANSINGMLWLDANNDGVRDAAEQPIVGYTVYLYAENDTDNAVQTAVTVADGTYSFFDVTAGSYVVGVISATVGGQEYLLPLVGITNDNAFAIASDWVNAYSEPISISDGGIVTGIDAGMRTPPGMQTMAVGDYVITNSIGALVDTQDNLWSAAWAVAYDAYCNGETIYTITVQNNVIETGRFNLENYLNHEYGIRDLTITITSAGATPYTITANEYGWLFDMGNNSLTLENITLDGYSGTKNAGGVRMTDGILTMKSSSTIRNFWDDDTNDYCGVSLVGSTFNMTDGEITGNKTNDNGGGVRLKDSIFTMTDGQITYNNASLYGGGVYLAEGSKFIMEGGTITGNTAGQNGGGVATGKDSEIIMKNGTVSHNKASSGDGGAIYVTAASYDGLGNAIYEPSSFVMEGGTISDNEATNGSGGGVVISFGSSFTMSETLSGVETKITNNTAGNGSGGGIYVLYDSSTNNKESSRSFNMSGGTISGNEAVSNVDSKGGGIAFFVGEYNEISPNISLTGGVIGDTNDTNDINEAYVGGGISVMNNSRKLVTLQIDGTKITGNNAVVISTGAVGYGGGIATINNPDNEGTIRLIINKGNISSNKSVGNGGGVCCDAKTSFKMTGGQIDWNEAQGNGGGVYFTSGSLVSFEMFNGIISNNKSGWEGGGLFIGAAILATISGTDIQITSNEAVSDGGGISFAGLGKLVIEGAEISGNKITALGWGDVGGGGVYCGADASLDIKNVKIVNNNLEVGGMKKGGGVYFNSTGLFTMTGGEISNNTRAYEGGGLYIAASATANITDTKIHANEAARGGGGIFFAEGTASHTIVNAVISENKAEWEGGGGLYISSGVTLTMSGAKIEGNEMTYNHGGGIYIENAPYSYSNLNIDAATTFSGNKAGVWYEPPTNVHAIYKTIDNTNYSSDTMDTTLTTDTSSPLNNYDINLVAYRVMLTLDDSLASLGDLGNIAATFTDNVSKQTVILSDIIEEYSGYPALDQDSNTYEYGIEMLSAGTWDANVNLPNGYSYEVSLNGETDVTTGKNFTINNDIKVKYIEIKITKDSGPPPWGKWIYKFK